MRHNKMCHNKRNTLNRAFLVGLVLFFLLAVVVLAGCQRQELVQSPSVPVAKTPPKAVSAPTEESSAMASKVSTLSQGETRTPTKRVRDLLAKQGLKVKSMIFMYQDPQNKPEKDRYFIKGEKMKIALAQLDHITDNIYVNTIYLDLSTQEAVGYCEAKMYRCKDPNKPFPVPLSKYERKTPVDWITGITYAEEIGSETIDNRGVTILQFEDDGSTVKMWLDVFFGVPLKIQVANGTIVDEYIFEDISFNSVTDDQLVHKTFENGYAVSKIDG
ncbi:hypothetical protein HY772_03655 [Candidatus Woesearchaeota archaeon]|nr:hypothetical protein [Candidatus Woesearchaeota archaeon]